MLGSPGIHPCFCEAVLDPLKPDLNAWLQKYMKSLMLSISPSIALETIICSMRPGDFLRKHPDLQDDLVLRAGRETLHYR